MKMWGEEKPTWRRDINKKAAQVQLEDWTRKKQPMEVPHGHLEECPKNKQLAGVSGKLGEHDQGPTKELGDERQERGKEEEGCWT